MFSLLNVSLLFYVLLKCSKDLHNNVIQCNHGDYVTISMKRSFAKNAKILAIYAGIDCVKFGLQGVIRGLGMQYKCFAKAFIIMYTLGIPISLILCFVCEMG